MPGIIPAWSGWMVEAKCLFNQIASFFYWLPFYQSFEVQLEA